MRRTRLGAAMISATFVATLATVSSTSGSVSAAPAAAAAYTAVQPCRLADTRTGVGFTRLDATTIEIAARGACGIPAGATSLTVTLTVDEPSAAGFLAAWPADQNRPTISNLNFQGGQTRANSSIVRLSSTGRFRVFTNVAANIVVDVVGAFVPATASRSGRFVALAPSRVLDTRGGARVASGGRVDVAVPAGVPVDAVALAMNITLTESSAPGFLTQYPAGQARPTSSVLNVDRSGQTRAAAGIFPISRTGTSLFLSGGGHVVVDITGYFTGESAPTSSDGLFVAADPSRLLDTRSASPVGTGIPLYPNGGLELATERGGAMAFNITAVDSGVGFVTAYPAGTPRPATSSVNASGSGDTVANFGISQVSNRGLGLFAQTQTHVLVDVQGWFSGSTATATEASPSNAPPPVPQPTYSACNTEGLGYVNSQRTAKLVTNPAAEAFACSYALQLAMTGVLTHSSSAARDAAVGCGTGENIAYASTISVANMYSMWYASSGHMANLKNSSYRSMGSGFIVRTNPNGSQTLWGVNVFAVC